MSDVVDAQRPSAAFDLLDPRIQQWIWRKRWPALRPAQEAAARPILDGTSDLIISAATAAGKTEAAFLPICTALLQPQAATATGIKVLYISPLKALINDQWGRLDALCEHLRIPVHRWHGDVAASRKATVLQNPDGILLITPESLEALFVNRGTAVPHLFAGLRYVVIDEMHAFFGTPRGAQLQSLLHRLDLAVRRRTPRIGLSATLGDMTQAQRYLRPHRPDTVLVIAEAGDSAELRLQVRGYLQSQVRPTERSTDGPHPDGDDAEDTDDQTVTEISRHLFRVLRGTTNLVFAGSRAEVEAFTDRLTRLSDDARVPNEFVPHHGGLSRGLREDVEQRLRDAGHPTTAICTSTLELGIDIGSAASVAQLGAPPSVAALRQRLGRSGRREGEAATLRVYISEPELTPQLSPVDTLRCHLLQTVAMVDLLLQSWFEPLDTADLHLSTLIQQILSMTAQHGGLLPTDAYRSLCTQGPFSAVTPAMFVQLLRDMGSAELLTQAGDGLLLPGSTGERLINHYSFYAVFWTLEEYRLITEGRTLGTLPIAFPLLTGSMLIFAGRRWKIIAVDDRQKVIELTRSSGGRPHRVSGDGCTVTDEVRARMLARYQDTDVPAYLDATGQRLLDEGRDFFRRWGLATRPVLRGC
ncbi:MAG: ATP-dependent helicase Lhr and Lhr-like helicase [Actinomycetota bacterium]|nr:ATP-dependent helicase Lhr and Lhr-like helicase [Actinomycetota bacterium]